MPGAQTGSINGSYFTAYILSTHSGSPDSESNCLSCSGFLEYDLDYLLLALALVIQLRALSRSLG